MDIFGTYLFFFFLKNESKNHGAKSKIEWEDKFEKCIAKEKKLDQLKVGAEATCQSWTLLRTKFDFS